MTELFKKEELFELFTQWAKGNQTKPRRRNPDATAQWDISNGGTPYTEEQIQTVLSDAPTEQNIIKHAINLCNRFDLSSSVDEW